MQVQEAGRVGKEDDGGHEDEPEGVTDFGLVLGTPAPVDQIFPDEHVGSEPHKVLDQPRDHGGQAEEEGNDIEGNETCKGSVLN